MADEMADEALPEDDSSVRFEDLTVDDDLPIIDRVVRYARSSIALQRLVHVKMLAETSELAGYAENVVVGGAAAVVVVWILLLLALDACSAPRVLNFGTWLTICCAILRH